MSRASRSSSGKVDYRRRPELYRIARGEQGVLTVEPYKSELLPHWRFRTPEEARKSARKLFALFRAYGRAGDFVGMDMARKFLQMGFTRSRRYANRSSGRKYAPGTRRLLPRTPDAEKARSAEIFYERWRKAAGDRTYLRLKESHRRKQEGRPQAPLVSSKAGKP